MGREEEDNQPRLVSSPVFGVSDVAVAMGDAQGRVVVYDALTGQVRWQAATLVRRMTHMLLDERHVIVAGLDGSGSDAQPIVCIYDAATGLRKHRLEKGSLRLPLAMEISEDGLVIQVSLNRIEAFDPARGELAWEIKGEDLKTQFAGAGGTWLGGDRLVVKTDPRIEPSIGSDLIWINLQDGAVIRRGSMRGLMDGAAQVVHDSGQWFLLNAERCIGLGSDGTVGWHDAISDPGRRLGIGLGDNRLLVIGVTTEADLLKTHERRLYLIDRRSGLIVREQHLAADEPIDGAQVSGDKLLLTGENITAAFSAAP